MKSTVALCLLCVAGAFVSPIEAQMGNTDVRYISDKSFFAMQFDMQKLFSYEKMGSKNLEMIAKFFEKQAHIDLMAMKTITVQFCESEGGGFDDDSFGFVMTFAKPIDKDMFLAEMKGIEFEEDSVDGTKYYRSTETYGPSICFTDGGKTVAMAKDETLKGMIGKKSTDSEIQALLKSADPGAEVKGAFLTGETYLSMLEEINAEIPFKPFNIVKVFGEAKSAIISGNVKSSTPIFLQVECKTEEGAEDLAKKGKLLIDLGKASIPLGRESLENELKRLEGKELKGFEKFQLSQAKMGIKGLEISEKILEGAGTSSQGKTATLKVKKMGGVKELIPMFAEMFATQFMAIQELQEGIELPEADFGEDFKKIEDELEEAIK